MHVIARGLRLQECQVRHTETEARAQSSKFTLSNQRFTIVLSRENCPNCHFVILASCFAMLLEFPTIVFSLYSGCVTLSVLQCIVYIYICVCVLLCSSRFYGSYQRVNVLSTPCSGIRSLVGLVSLLLAADSTGVVS